MAATPDVAVNLAAEAAPSAVETAPVGAPEAGAEEALETPIVGAEQPIEGEQPETAEQPETKEEDLSEFKVPVAARLQALAKSSPLFAQAMNENPKLADSLAATFRREEGFREQFSTVAEAREMREMFPRGAEDAQQLVAEIEEVAELDGLYYSNDPVSHEQFIRNLHEQDPKTFRSLLSTLPQVWAKLDPDSYQKVFSGILGATFESEGLPAFVQSLRQAAEAGDVEKVKGFANELSGWLDRFTPKAKKTLDPREQELERRQKELDDRDRAASTKQREAFNASFTQSEVKNQTDAIQKLIGAKLPKTLSEARRTRITEDIRAGMVKYLGSSRPFMRALKAAFDEGDMNKALAISKSAWSRLLPGVARRVLNEETQTIVQGNRETVERKRAAAARTEVRGAAPTRTPTPVKSGPEDLSSLSMKERVQRLMQKSTKG
jgi:hypothetical protein